MARPLEQNMGADALRRATGRDHTQWWAQGLAHDRVDPAKAALIALLEAVKTR